MKHLLVTGGAGFIGSNFVETALRKGYRLTVLDALTYAGHRANLKDFLKPGVCDFILGRIEDPQLLEKLFSEQSFDGVVHFAAESHVDNSITGPRKFLVTNIMGTFELLEVARRHWAQLTGEKQKNFRFLHISTDEVFGSLGETGKFKEETPYAPNSPYSSSKAGSDHLVRAWFHTYGLPTVMTNCSNNYGPRQFPEKLIPRMITNALKGKPLPVYGKGANIRDWIHVQDHCEGVLLAFEKGTPGESYCFGGNSERNNLDVVKKLCEILNQLSPRKDGRSHSEAIQFVEDRLGHDFRYAIDDEKAQKELGFKRKYSNFEQGLDQTVKWYLENSHWLQEVTAEKKGL
ncbi:MAG: dTDP-glucose 4,6-dehydratase [Pseudobdellovibrionaceae bacterium]